MIVCYTSQVSVTESYIILAAGILLVFLCVTSWLVFDTFYFIGTGSVSLAGLSTSSECTLINSDASLIFRTSYI